MPHTRASHVLLHAIKILRSISLNWFITAAVVFIPTYRTPLVDT